MLHHRLSFAFFGVAKHVNRIETKFDTGFEILTNDFRAFKYLKRVENLVMRTRSSRDISPDFSLTVQFDFAGNTLNTNVDVFDLIISVKNWDVLDTEPLILSGSETEFNLGIGKKTRGIKVEKTTGDSNLFGSYSYKIKREDLESAAKSGKLKFSAGTKTEKIKESGRTAFKYILKLGTL